MKILILNMFYYPNLIGGAEHSVKLLAEHLAAKGHKVSVLTMDGIPSSNLQKAEKINGVFVYRAYDKGIYERRILNNKANITDKLWNGIHLLWNPKMNRIVKKIIDFTTPDIIHTNNLASMSCQVWKYADKKGYHVVHTLRDYCLMDWTTVLGGSRTSLVKIYRFYQRALSNKMRGMVTAPSQAVLSVFLKDGFFKNCSHKCVPNSIAIDWEKLDKCIQEKRSRNNNTISFLYAGVLSENKGVKKMIQAFSRCTHKNISLRICGNGVLLEWVKKIAARDQRIQVMGKLSVEVLSEEYERADILIVPSLWVEPFGRIVIEAAQYGVPTIGSDRGGIPETVKKLRYGVCYDGDSIEELKLLIDKYSERRNVLNLIKSGPRHLNLYDISKQIQSFEDIYDKLQKT